MQKIILTIGKFVFFSVVVVFTVGFFSWEIVTLSKLQNKNIKEVSAAQPQNDKTNNLLISEAGDNNKGTFEVNNEVSGDDARPLIIKRYLEKYNSPLAPYSNLIFELSKTYGYEYYWIVAIAQQESNLCKKIPENSHNCWGYGIHKSGTLKFDNYELAIRSYAEYLKREYFDKGFNTPELIMKKYCPSSNGSWAYGVGHFIEEMESGNF